jgi:hypothetical protein
MEDINWQKYSQSPELTQKLLDTGDAVIEEGNTWGDTFWGVSGGEGRNELGKIIEDIRDKLRAGGDPLRAEAMTSYLNEGALEEKTWQAAFPEKSKCPHCGGEARFAFVSHEDDEEDYVCDKHKNEPDGDGFWPHDAIAVAVYICKECMEPVAEMNQG